MIVEYTMCLIGACNSKHRQWENTLPQHKDYPSIKDNHLCCKFCMYNKSCTDKCDDFNLADCGNTELKIAKTKNTNNEVL